MYGLKIEGSLSWQYYYCYYYCGLALWLSFYQYGKKEFGKCKSYVADHLFSYVEFECLVLMICKEIHYHVSSCLVQYYIVSVVLRKVLCSSVEILH